MYIITNIRHKKKLLFRAQFYLCLLFPGHPVHSALAICILALRFMGDVAAKLPLHHCSKWWDRRKEDDHTVLNSCLSEETAQERGNLVLDSNIYFSRFVSTTVLKKKSCVCAICVAFWCSSRDVQQPPWKILIIFKLISQFCDVFWNVNRSFFSLGL